MIVRLTCASLVALAGLASTTGAAHQVNSREVPAQFDRHCNADAAQIVILGTYHMNNPRLDARNVDADDVLAPRRQREIEDLVARLARFRPTKVMIEADRADTSVHRRYQLYREGRHDLTRDESEQVGFRLAARLGLATVTPVDFPMRMSGLRPDELNESWVPPAARSPSSGDSSAARVGAGSVQLSEDDRRLRAMTVSAYLYDGNDPARIERQHAENYLELLLPEDTPSIYARSDYLANWYRRNFRIFANIDRETRFPSDRVLVLMGQGHSKILRDLAIEAPYFCLQDVREYLR